MQACGGRTRALLSQTEFFVWTNEHVSSTYEIETPVMLSWFFMYVQVVLLELVREPIINTFHSKIDV